MDTADDKPENKNTWWVESLAMILAVFMVSGLIQTFGARVYLIPSGSMEPTLHGCHDCVNDKILVDKISTHFTSPEQGDVVVFKGPPSWNVGYVVPRHENKIIAGVQDIGSFFGVVVPRDNTLVKRVVATQGQTIRCLPGDTGITVDGKVLSESYVLSPPQKTIAPELKNCGGKFFGPITVPRGNVFVMGDNRTNSSDSRYHTQDQYYGTVPVDNIIGYARVIIYPFDRVSFIGKDT